MSAALNKVDTHTSGFLVLRPTQRVMAYLERWYITRKPPPSGHEEAWL